MHNGLNENGSLRSWRYCVGGRLTFWRRSRVPKKGSRDEAVFLAAPPSNLTRLLHNIPPATQCMKMVNSRYPPSGQALLD